MAHRNFNKLGIIMQMTGQFVTMICSYFYMALFNNKQRGNRKKG